MPLSMANLQIGQTHSQVLIDDLTRGHIVGYAAAVGDYAAEHTDEVYSTQVAGLPSVFAHAMFTAGMTARMLTNWAGAGRILRFGVRFSPTRAWPGDTLTATATVEAIHADDNRADLVITATNARGDRLLSCYATIRVDD
jgi:acyl dehydratase